MLSPFDVRNFDFLLEIIAKNISTSYQNILQRCRDNVLTALFNKTIRNSTQTFMLEIFPLFLTFND